MFKWFWTIFWLGAPGLLTILRSYLSFVSTTAMLRRKLAQNSAIVQLYTNRYSLPAWYLEMANNSLRDISDKLTMEVSAST